ncbi:MAG: 16S rRNA (cytosine(1402)-N(4))-methyltransferase [Candidatus Wildermuthbacteria bacterium RIFCSPLOWO2_02_FULL_47_9c]|uniref:Ribosomal RNA small subunit methyltransferase H n=2 Tax=Parcubacteria group TaxID=1794811 RepID=A0A837IP40_9BACT|nr:MAG: S-adenosyl-methyltransferase MraW, S-adenosyl-methyltransferase [Candidatus Yanofskybacteria bacterium GW2011_GWC1_48_11]KKW04652.1 MAG: Ribosomal RNA small subunit methyltransferase H [Parcubacteria group bacterium GW2011_GWB1_49_12]KKW09047.1 MAG: Ribosomal RNA small subunit methyltransferase H [Parcubacteria group bacterium GW2011_GWA1_49_26]KKW13640.1 MAG: Ribosomal RNA small subunit methyltransferase H [Parcubacteria group bacterium GW2011_GWA2_50_10]OHA61096.1 MAG: 16S rRNA (cytos
MHIPVLKEKVLEYLNPQPNQNFIDCTAGGGGHATAILERIAPKGKVLAIDWDREAISRLRATSRLVPREGNFAEVKEIANREKFLPVHGVLFDLGLSTTQLEESKRGFSFQLLEPLDMRYNAQQPVTAEKILNYSSKAELERILKEYGEEQFAGKIAQAIVQARAQKHIEETSQLVEIIEEATPRWYHRKRIHPATKTFQALRIATNNELENLERGLQGATELIVSSGKIAVISFHSLEDRIVKNFFKQEPSLKPFTKKPTVPTNAEIKKNPRARSAKLRVAIKL